MGGLSSSSAVGKCGETAILGPCLTDGRVCGSAGPQTDAEQEGERESRGERE